MKINRKYRLEFNKIYSYKKLLEPSVLIQRVLIVYISLSIQIKEALN